MPDPSDRLKAALADRYAIERELGAGGMATVYLARDVKHDRQVALKVLRPDLAVTLGPARFLREIQIAARLTHPHILPLHDSGEADSFLYYVMPYVEGESLRDRLAREKQLPLEDALQIAREVADALSYAHSHDVVHRDIKPENILFEGGHAVVSDFGIARAISAAGGDKVTEAGLVLGTPAYLSPEQASGEQVIDGRADIYALGCVLYELLAGQPPFTGPTTESVVHQHLAAEVRPVTAVRPAVPAEVTRALERALAKTPADRFTTAAQFAEALASSATDAGRRSHPQAAARASARRTQEAGSIAVLPFVNMSAEKENEYFSDGMTEELINALTKVEGLRVAARTSSFAFKGKQEDIRAIGSRLNVETVLEGSVRWAGNRLRITAQLVDVADGYHLWSETYDRTLADVFAVQDELARAIVGALSRTLAGTVNRPLVHPATNVLDAYALYLRGRYFANKRTVDGFRTAIGYFQQAIERDPRYALAYAGLAECHALRGFEEFGDLPAPETMPKAKAAALQALEIDPALAEAYGWLGAIAMLYDWDWRAAERAFEQAISLNPRSVLALVWYAIFLSAMGRHDESIRLIAGAEALDPLNLVVQMNVGRCYYFAARYDEALAQLQATLEMEPGHALVYVWLARAYSAKGLFQEALAELEKGMSRVGRIPILLMMHAYTYGRLGKRAEALENLRELQRQAQRCFVPAMYEAYVWTGLGDLDEAFRHYERAHEQRSGYLAFLRADPLNDERVRSDPRFAALKKRMRLDFAAT